MSDRKVSRAHNIYLNPPTVLRTWLDVKIVLLKIEGLKERDRADLVSALNTVGNMHRLPGEGPKDVDRALARMEADPRLVTRFLDRHKAAKKGLKAGSWTNIAYRVKKAMRLTGAGPRIGIKGRPIADQRYYKLPVLPYQAALGTFMRWREAEAIPLEATTSAVVEKFGDWLNGVPGMRACPRSTLLATVRHLNDAATAFPEFWPPLRVSVPHLHDRYVLPWEAFAPEFKLDAENRTAYVINPPITDGVRAIKAHVAKKQNYEMRRLASALVKATGRDPKTITSIRDLVEFDAFVAIVQFLIERLKRRDPKATTSGGVYVTSEFLCGLAANWVKLDKERVEELRRISRQRDPNPAARGEGQRKVRRTMTPKNRATLGHFRDPGMLGRFLDLPAAIFARVLKQLKKYGCLKRKDAVALSWAFAVALLQIAPVRPKNGSGILLGKDGGNLFEQGAGASRRVFVHWTPEEVKNGVELEFELTGETLELFDLYMKHARPLLCGPSNRFLFPGRGDTSKQTSWFSTQIAQNLGKELGVPVTGHQFRHLMGFIFLLDNPGQYEAVRQFLGHTNIETTIAFYAGIEMQDAAKALDGTVKKRRAELAAKAKRSIRSRSAT